MSAGKEQEARSECDPCRIRDFLESDQYQLEASDLIQHLDECEACRQLLESEVGGTEVWGRITDLLRPSEFDQASRAEFSSATRSGPLVDQPSIVKEVLASLVPAEDPYHLGRLGPYQITGVVGVGGMGVVLKAIDPSLDRVVAVKVMSPRLANQEKARQRFAREAKAAAAVLHPNVVPIHSVSSETTLPYLVMACIRGGSLQKRLEREGALPLVEILRIGSQIAAGLAAAHEQGLVHRDIKPENILLEEGVERVTITDFGLARAVDDHSVTQLGAIAGTPQYMSPEQARGEVIDQQSDLFSLGCVLYALCTGRPPFQAETSYVVMRKIIDENPVPIQKRNREIPEWMSRIVNKLMAKQPSERFRSAQEVYSLLEECLSHVQQPNSKPLPSVISRGDRRIWRWLGWGGAACAAALLVVAMFYVFNQMTRPYSATQFGPFVDMYGRQITELPEEQAVLSSGRVTLGDRERLVGRWDVVYQPLMFWEVDRQRFDDAAYFFEPDDFVERNLRDSTRTPSKGVWTLRQDSNPRQLEFILDGRRRKAIYKLEGDFLSLYFESDAEKIPSKFPSPVEFWAGGTLLVLQRAGGVNWDNAVTFEHRDMAIDEAEIFSGFRGSIDCPNLTKIAPVAAESLVKSQGSIRLPSLQSLNPELASALATKSQGWILFDGLQELDPVSASNLASSRAALSLGVSSLSTETARAFQNHRQRSFPRLRTVTPELAAALVGTGNLTLNGLTKLDVELAAALAQHQGCLTLDGVESISPEVAVEFQAFAGEELNFNRIKVMDDRVAEAFSTIKPLQTLSFNLVYTLTPESAAALSSVEHRFLSLQGLDELSDEALRVLRRRQRALHDSGKGQIYMSPRFNVADLW